MRPTEAPDAPNYNAARATRKGDQGGFTGGTHTLDYVAMVPARGEVRTEATPWIPTMDWPSPDRSRAQLEHELDPTTASEPPRLASSLQSLAQAKVNDGGNIFSLLLSRVRRRPTLLAPMDYRRWLRSNRDYRGGCGAVLICAKDSRGQRIRISGERIPYESAKVVMRGRWETLL